MTKIEQAILVAVECLYVPYIWGGNEPNNPDKDQEKRGLDCSGFIGYVLREVGLLPEGYDRTAQGYFDKYRHLSVTEATPGCIAFYGKSPKKITHCMLVVNPTVVIGAVRGHKWMETIVMARKRNARIDSRDITFRSDLIKIVNPFTEDEVDG